MTIAVNLGSLSEQIVQDLLATGRFKTASEVVEAALLLMEDRERRLTSIDLGISRGLADIEAGSVFDAERMFDELDAELAELEGRK